MKATAALILVTLALGSPVMARDTNYEYAPPLHGETEAERLFNSPRGQELQAVVDLLMKGDKEGAEEALQAYRKKYGEPSYGSQPGAQQERPQSTYEFGPPMMLPPEAR